MRPKCFKSATYFGIGCSNFRPLGLQPTHKQKKRDPFSGSRFHTRGGEGLVRLFYVRRRTEAVVGSKMKGGATPITCFFLVNKLCVYYDIDRVNAASPSLFVYQRVILKEERLEACLNWAKQ
jgi:hypothetical protein